jgi:hypothetical protein
MGSVVEKRYLHRRMVLDARQREVACDVDALIGSGYGGPWAHGAV